MRNSRKKWTNLNKIGKKKKLNKFNKKLKNQNKNQLIF